MIKKRNLDPSLVQWIMTQTGLGPGIGEIKYAAPASSSTSQFRTQLESMGVDSGDIYTLPSLAYDAMVTNRNDVMLVSPGSYAETVSLAWDLDNTHAIGMAGPRCWTDYGEAGVSIYTSTAAVAETVNVTGDYCQFHGINIANNGANTGNLAALKLNGYGGIMKGCSFDGAMNTTNDVAAAAAVYVHSNAHDYVFEDCRIGDASWWTRDQANSGQLAFTGTNSYNGMFKNSIFQMQSETAACCLVRIATTNCLRLDTFFDNCLFTNQSVNYANQLNQVFYQDAQAITTNRIFLHNCAMSGFDEWQDSNYATMFQSSMGVATIGGGICIEPTSTIA